VSRQVSRSGSARFIGTLKTGEFSNINEYGKPILRRISQVGRHHDLNAPRIAVTLVMEMHGGAPE
jgi:hypothetical protein